MGVNWKKVTTETLFNRDDGICNICGKELNIDDLFEIDHIIEKAKGGSDDISNLRIVHLSCHRKRHHPNRVALPTKRTHYDIQRKDLYKGTMKDTEKSLLINVLQKTKWNKSNAAKILGISERMVRYKVLKHNITVSDIH